MRIYKNFKQRILTKKTRDNELISTLKLGHLKSEFTNFGGKINNGLAVTNYSYIN
jgi:hypothetical protein